MEIILFDKFLNTIILELDMNTTTNQNTILVLNIMVLSHG